MASDAPAVAASPEAQAVPEAPAPPSPAVAEVVAPPVIAPPAAPVAATAVATAAAPVGPAAAAALVGTPIATPVAAPLATPGGDNSPGKKKKDVAAAALLAAGASPLSGDKATPKKPLDLKHERLVGVISKLQAASGSGFIKSHLFEGELFFRTERIMPEFQGHPLQEGESVEFDVQADDHGRPHAVAMKPVLGRRPNECLGQRHRGYVRRLAERWGFLNSAAFDGDLFVHRDNLLQVPDQMAEGQPPLRAGQAVEFDVALDDRGRTVAKQITTCALLRPADWIGHRLHGYIRSFQGAWGFINSDRFAGDLFVHRDSLLPQHQGAQLTVGTIVEFDVERDHHRKGTSNRLVARQVAVLGPGAEAYQTQQPMTGTLPQPQQPLPMGPAAYSAQPPAQPFPQAASYAQTAPMYYQQPGAAPAGMPPDPNLGAVGYGAPPYPPQPQYMQMPMLPQQQALSPQAYAQPQYGQQPFPPPAFGQPSMPQMPPMPQMPQMAQLPPVQGQPGAYLPPPVQHTPQAYLPPGVTPAATEDHQQVAQAALLQPPAQSMAPPGQADPTQGMTGAVPVAPDGQAQGLLHITMHDWEPDQPGQLRVTKGTLVTVSYKAAHGWVYAGTVQQEPLSEGWIPQAVVKRVSLCRVAIDWQAEGQGTLGVAKGETIAVSKEAERGWVYGERIGPRQADRPSDGWLPKKVLDTIQA